MESDFSFALREVKAGKKIRRTGWKDKNKIILLKCGLYGLCLCVRYSDGDEYAWFPNQTDILANDWIIVE